MTQYDQQIRHRRDRLLGAGAIVLSAAFLFLWMPREAPGWVASMYIENGPIELLTALCYLVGCGICIRRIITGSPGHRFYLYLWGLLCFIFFGEETSWLQHIIGYKTPAIMEEINVQGEFNIHNLIGGGSIHQVLQTGRLDWRLFLDTQSLFRLGFFTYFMFVPACAHAGLFRGVLQRLGYPRPTLTFVVSVWVTLLISILGYLFAADFRSELTEFRELYYGLFILLYVQSSLQAEECTSCSR